MELKKIVSFSKKGRTVLIVSLFVFVISFLGLYYIIFGPNWKFLNFINNYPSPIIDANNVDKGQNNEPEPIECPDCVTHWLSGELVFVDQAESYPIAIMIDNDLGARPQIALSQASLVYEVPVEGGMTRYLAVYPAHIEINKVGPIRSARSYFVSLAEELKAVFLHVGGSPESLKTIKNASLYDLNEFYNENYFWRDTSGNRQAPHHIFSNSENWNRYLANRGLKDRQADSWLFKDESPSLKSSNDIEIIFSANFQALWRYQPESNQYLRFFNGREAWDDNAQIKAKNVIIQKVNSRVVDELGRLDINLKGAGEAIICLDGLCQLGDWKKPNFGRTRYYYKDGEEVKLNPGISWIEIADNVSKINY